MNSKENIIRKLKEEPLLVTSFWCRFGLHNWTKYNEPVDYEGAWRRRRRSQDRRCASCNKFNHWLIPEL